VTIWLSESREDNGTLIILILVITILIIALPFNTQIKVLTLPVYIVPTLILIDGSFSVSLLFSLASTWSQRHFRGPFGRELRSFLGVFQTATRWILPLEIFYIIGFLAIAIQNEYLWANLQLYLPIGLYGILFLFTWEMWRNSAEGLYQLIARLLYLFRNYRKIHRPRPPGSRPLVYYLLNSTVPVWAIIWTGVLGYSLSTTVLSHSWDNESVWSSSLRH